MAEPPYRCARRRYANLVCPGALVPCCMLSSGTKRFHRMVRRPGAIIAGDLLAGADVPPPPAAPRPGISSQTRSGDDLPQENGYNSGRRPMTAIAGMTRTLQLRTSRGGQDMSGCAHPSKRSIIVISASLLALTVLCGPPRMGQAAVDPAHARP